MKNRFILRAFLVIVLCAFCFTLTAPAQAAAVMKTGTCGENLTWTLDDTGLLTISGTGDMLDYDVGEGRWFPYWESITAVVIEEGVTSIGTQAFAGCSNLVSAAIPESVTKIGEKAFIDCTSLTSVIIPNSVTTLGKRVFQGCSSLTAVTLPSNITIIREFSFSGCSSLVSIIIPDSVSVIGECAFENCTGLLSVTVPVAVVRIGLRAFHNCKRLWHVFYKGTEQDWEKINIHTDQNEFHWAGRHYTCNGYEKIDPATGTCEICVERCEHNWNTGTVTKQPTATEEGVLTYTCIDCNSKKTEPIEKSNTPPVDNEDPTVPNDSAPVIQDYTNDASGIIPWWWLPVVAGVCLVGNAILILILLKKKK